MTFWHPKLKKIQNKNNKYALAVGRLEKVKGFDLLIASWKNICANLVIIGSGKERNKLNELIEQNNLSEKVKIIDVVKKEDQNITIDTLDKDHFIKSDKNVEDKKIIDINK